jgi:hypothetical protein
MNPTLDNFIDLCQRILGHTEIKNPALIAIHPALFQEAMCEFIRLERSPFRAYRDLVGGMLEGEAVPTFMGLGFYITSKVERVEIWTREQADADRVEMEQAWNEAKLLSKSIGKAVFQDPVAD